MPTILVIEDDPTIRLTMEFALTKANYGVSTAADGSTGLDIARKIKPDLILLDLMLPGMSGIDVARTLRLTDSETPIIMVTALGSDEDKVRGLDAGADDYITKPFSTKELLARIRANMRRVNKSSEKTEDKIYEYGDLSIDTSSTRVSVKDQLIKLRSKEYELLVAMASRPGALARREWLARTVWGEEFLSTSRTIDVHVRRIRKAIEGISDYYFIHTVHGMGYRFEAVHKTDAKHKPDHDDYANE
ncbi:MAG: response regulator transcription factor [Coriobacteriia bacterium]|nr:response regulator transcription factor [Coriobacteriia bacterium]